MNSEDTPEERDLKAETLAREVAASLRRVRWEMRIYVVVAFIVVFFK